MIDESMPTMPEDRPIRPSERVDELCDRFEAAWRAAAAPRIEHYLAELQAADRAAHLRELVALERELRRKRGERPAVQDYLDRFPEHAEVIRAVFGAAPREGGGPTARPPGDTGRNLLFGVLALQNNFIGRDDLVAAFAVWVANKARPLASILTDRGALDDSRRALLEALVAEHLRQHGGDMEASLAAVSSLGSVREDLGLLGDRDVEASLAAAASRHVGDTGATVTYVPSARRAGERFRILRFHREGGLGRVYVARDEELGREVALKEIRSDKLSEVDLRGRFVLEAEINGGLEHPGIVPVYSLGTYDDGRPFYAMRFVEGDSLKEAIEAYHKEHPRPDPGAVEFRKLLGRFVGVCEAIAFAHSRGVLHRDLKPHNVMLGRYGETLLIDWGLAKATGRREPVDPESAREATLVPPSGSGHAPTLGVLGSPPYMSPEQAAGAVESVGPATDVYGLGAILFALLTGEAPVEGGAIEEVLERARRGAILSPRSLNPKVPRALEAVCLKALALRQQERYPTARALSEDVEHWLADEPVSARRDSMFTRAWRSTRKHRTLATTAVALVVFGLLGLAVVYRREATHSAELTQANASLTAANHESERWLGEAFQAIEDYYTAVGESVLRERPDLAELRGALLQKPRTFYERLTAEYATARPEDYRARDRLAHGHIKLGQILRILGRNDQALSHLQTAVALFDNLVARQPDVSKYQIGLANASNELGNVLRDSGQPLEAEVALKRAATVCEALVALQPDVPDYRHRLAACYINLGVVLRQSGRTVEAESALRKAIAASEALVARHPDVAEFRDKLALGYNNLSNLFYDDSRVSESERASKNSIAAYEALVVQHPDVTAYRQGLARANKNFGVLLKGTGRPVEAHAAYTKAIAGYTTLVARQPEVPDYQHELARSYLNLAGAFDLTGRPGDAEEALTKGIAAAETLVARHPDIPDYGFTLAAARSNLGVLLGDNGRQGEAEHTLTRAIEASEALVARRPDVTNYQLLLAEAYTNLGQVIDASIRPSEAEGALKKAIAGFETLVKKEPQRPIIRSNLNGALRNLGLCLARQGRHDEALSRFLQAIGSQRPLVARHPQVTEFRQGLSKTYRSLVDSLYALGRVDEAVMATRECVKLQSGNRIELYDAACSFAVCVSMRGTASQKPTLADEAMAALRAAVAAGYADGAKMSRDADLVPLHDRTDFRALVARLLDRCFPADPFAP